MIKKKGKFLTFLFALIPGAGQMYMGFMKLGVSLMGMFALVICISSWLDFSSFIFLLPIIWCYAFFDAIHKNSLTDEEFYALEDHYCVSHETIESVKHAFNGKERQVISIVLILIGVDILWKNFFWLLQDLMPWFIYNQIYSLVYRVPQVLIACIVIYVGYHLMKKKKMDLLEKFDSKE